MAYAYESLKKLGGRSPKSSFERFHSSYVQVPIGGCWVWMGTMRGSHGYGAIKSNGVVIPAHRFSYQLHVGDIPDGMIVCHRCDNPMCVNPHHLFVGTVQDNSNDKVKKQRQARGSALAMAQEINRPRGERNGLSVLKKHEAEEIKVAIGSQRAIAAKYGVSQATVSSIRLGKTWK